MQILKKKNTRKLFSKLTSYAVIASLLIGLTPESGVAADLDEPSHILASNIARANTDHSISFSTSTTSEIKRIQLRFSTTQNGTLKPSYLELGSASLSGLTGTDNNWTVNTSNSASGILLLLRNEPTSIPASTNIGITLGNITNPAIGDCITSGAGLMDTCHLRITTYLDDGMSAVDEGRTTYQVFEDPYFNFEITGTPSSTGVNGITTNRPSSGKEIALNHIQKNQTVYANQQINIETNAPNGYTVYAYLENPLSGINPSNNFDPFAGISTTWANPTAWETPAGIEPSTHTGWVGIHTSDERAGDQWIDAQGLFAPLTTVPRIVAKSESADRSGSIINLTFAFEVNGIHPADVYTANIRYHVETYY